MIITINDINKDQLGKWINLMDGYHGISVDDKSWLYNAESKANKTTLYCFLIGQGLLYVIDRRLQCRINGYEALIEFVEELFKGKSIVNFTDLFFLSEINQAFCYGKWHNVHQSWLIEREDYFEIIDLRNPKVHRDPTAYVVEVYDCGNHYDYFYYILRGRRKTTIVNSLELSVKWAPPSYTTYQFKIDFNYKDARISYSPILLEEFYSRLMEVFN